MRLDIEVQNQNNRQEYKNEFKGVKKHSQTCISEGAVHSRNSSHSHSVIQELGDGMIRMIVGKCTTMRRIYAKSPDFSYDHMNFVEK